MSNNSLRCFRCKGQHHPVACPMDNRRELKFMDDLTKIKVLRSALSRLIERIDFNGGLGEYQGGPSFVMKQGRDALEETGGANG